MTTDLELIRAGREAADEIITKVLGVVSVEKAEADPNTPQGFDKFVIETLNAIKDAAGPTEKAALKDLIQKLQRQWGGLSPAEREKVIKDAATKYLKVTDELIGVVPGALFETAPKLVLATKKFTKKRTKLRIEPTLSLVDEVAMAHIAATQSLYIRDEMGQRIEGWSILARKVVSEGLEAGYDDKEIGKRLGAKLNTTGAARADSYWRMIATVFVSRGRTWSQLSGYHEAGIEAYQWEAVGDEVTCPVCLFLNGQVFRVAPAIASFGHVQQATENGDPEAVKDLQPWMQVGKGPDDKQALFYQSGGKKQLAAVIEPKGGHSSALSPTQLQARGIGQPPAHGRCFPAGVIVEGRFSGGLKGLYAGKILQLKTRAGRDLSVTPKHEILTARGFLLAEQLRVGDQLIAYRSSFEPRMSGPDGENEHNGPARIEDVFGALQDVRSSLRVEARRALDLHGDELSFESHVDIVGAESELGGWVKPAGREVLGELGLEGSNPGERASRGLGSLHAQAERLLSTSHGSPSSRALPLDGSAVVAQTRPFDLLLLGSASQLDGPARELTHNRSARDPEFLAERQNRGLSVGVSASSSIWENESRSTPAMAPSLNAQVDEPLAHDLGADFEFASDIQRRHPSFIETDELIQIDALPFVDHVYDLQTDVGWFVASGIVVANCRCTSTPVFGNETMAPEPPPPPERVSPPPPPIPPAPAVQQALPFPVQLPPNLAELVRPLPPAVHPEAEGTSPTGPAEPPAPKLDPKIAAQLKELEDWPTPKDLGKFGDKFALGTFSGAQGPPLDDYGSVKVPHPKPHKSSITAAFYKKEPQTIPLSQVVLTAETKPLAHKPTVADFLKAGLSPKDLAENHKLLAVKWEGKYYVPSPDGTNAAVLADHHKTDFQAYVVDLDALKAKKAKQQAAKEKKAAKIALPVELPVAPLPKAAPALEVGTEANIMHQKVGEQRGSNAGGFYVGKDGIKRYVKFYDDEAQAHGEHLANQVYRDLGFEAPVSQLFKLANGKIGYSSQILEGQTFQQKAPNKEQAKAFMDGFVADVLTGNWDAAGSGLDNAMVTSSGRIARIDAGGTFLFRAKAGRKPANVLNQITEWDVFFSAKNPDYKRIASLAGYDSAEDMADAAKVQIKRVLALEKAHGNWGNYLEKHTPGLKSDRDRMEGMLASRSRLLEEKLKDLERPKPAPQKVQAGVGVGRYVASQHSTILPSKGLKLADLAETDAEATWDKEKKKYGYGVLPSGEDHSTYKKRARQAIAKAPSSAQSAIKHFTGSGSGSVRSSEEAGKPNAEAKAIATAFGAADAEPGTVFRGINTANKYSLTREQKQEILRFFLETDKPWGLGVLGAGASSSSSWDLAIARDQFMGGVGDVHGDDLKVLFKINGRTQIPIETISGVEFENELLFSRHARFRTTGLSRMKGKKRILVIECEEVTD